jgi:hypothetical protein
MKLELIFVAIIGAVTYSVTGNQNVILFDKVAELTFNKNEFTKSSVNVSVPQMGCHNSPSECSERYISTIFCEKIGEKWACSSTPHVYIVDVDVKCEHVDRNGNLDTKGEYIFKDSCRLEYDVLPLQRWAWMMLSVVYIVVVWFVYIVVG